jgi:hypothetical protein
MSEPVEGRYEGAAQEKATAPAQPDIQHIPVGPRKMCLKPLCIQQFRGGSAVPSGDSVRERVPNPVVRVDDIEIVSGLQNPPIAWLTRRSSTSLRKSVTTSPGYFFVLRDSFSSTPRR